MNWLKVDAGHHRLGGEVDGLLRGTALPVDGGPRYRHGELRRQHRVAADVHRLLADLHHAPHENVLDEGRIGARAIDQGVEHAGRQIHRMPARQPSPAPTARGTHRGNNVCLSHSNSSSMS